MDYYYYHNWEVLQALNALEFNFITLEFERSETSCDEPVSFIEREEILSEIDYSDNPPLKKVLIIVTFMRSGSTFLGEIFNNHDEAWLKSFYFLFSTSVL